MRTRNKGNIINDDRNKLILEFLRIVEGIRPEFIMMENVPGIINYNDFIKTVDRLIEIGYKLDYKIVNVEDYGVPQRRRRLVLLGSLSTQVTIPQSVVSERSTVKDYIFNLPHVDISEDPMHKNTTKHSEKVKNIIALIPKDGGSRKDLPPEHWLECHKKSGVGFSDIYGRLSWNKVSSTITGGS